MQPLSERCLKSQAPAYILISKIQGAKGGSMKRYQAPGGMRYHFRNAFTYLGMVAVCICLSGCSTFAERYFQRSVDPAGGELQLSGLKEAVTVRRDAYGIPYVE